LCINFRLARKITGKTEAGGRMLALVLILSALITIVLIVRMFSFLPHFHWLELTALTFFFIGINSWAFDFYLAGFLTSLKEKSPP
jgi:uncharacterized membrane protein